VIDTSNKLECLSEKMADPVNFQHIQCGYSHALLLDEENKAYSFGAGLYGQLGTETENDLA